jgi:hypothetical protein
MANQVSLDSIVNAYIDETEQSVHKFFKLWQLCFRGMEQLGIDFFFMVKSVRLPVLPNKTVEIPADFLQYSKVGMPNAKGEVVCLKYNSNISTYADQINDRLSKVKEGSIGTTNSWDYASSTFYNYNGLLGQNVYGYPSGSPFIGSFKIDTDNNLIVLDVNFKYDYLILEYVSSPKEGQEYFVPFQFKEALIAYLAWKDIANLPVKTHVQNSNVDRRRREFFNERRLALARWNPFRSQDAHNLNLESNRLTIKA